MSTAWFPSIPGINWTQTRTPRWDSLLVQRAANPFAEARMLQQSYPQYDWQLSFSYLHSIGYPTNSLAGFYEALLGFFNSQFGGLVSFGYRDQYDNQVTNQPIGTGDGTTTAFQLQRTYGGFTEPVGIVDTRGSVTYGPYTRPAALTPVAKVGGSPASATFNNDTGVVTYASAPGAATALTATFSYGWRVRFEDDILDFETLYYQIWKLGKLRLLQVAT
jgi:uncharacterized protein (TIGR02217 family)